MCRLRFRSWRKDVAVSSCCGVVGNREGIEQASYQGIEHGREQPEASYDDRIQQPCLSQPAWMLDAGHEGPGDPLGRVNNGRGRPVLPMTVAA